MGFTKFVYSVIGWLNKSESLTTPLGKLNLRHMDDGIKTIGDNLNAAYEELNTGKLDKDTAYTMVSDLDFDENTGIFTVTRLNGATFTIDTKLEKIITNWTFDKESQQLILTLDDGTKQGVDLSALITQYEFLDTETIAFTIGSDGKVSANVKDGSITEEKLQPNYLADIKTQATNAAESAVQASDSSDDAEYDAKLAQSYAIGGSGVRDGENTDNAKYYKEQAKNSSDSASNSASSALASSQTATTKASEAATSATNASKSEGNASTYATNASNSATSASSSATTATQKASEASTSATNASNSANTATTKANEAKSSADAAALSESNALASETAAAQSESNAKTSESNATNSAKSASASATSASSSAATATNKATEAANSASDASTSANTATTKAIEASSSASSASKSASSASTYSTKAQSYAVGGTGARENEDIDNAKYYYQQSKSISESFSGALRPMGTVAFANLPSVSSAAEGDMYNISDEFITTTDFKEGSGLKILAGSNVYKTFDGKWDILAGIHNHVISDVDGLQSALDGKAASSHTHSQYLTSHQDISGKLDNSATGADSLLSKITTSWTSIPTDDTYFIRQDIAGGNSFGRVTFSTLWSYIKGKADKVYSALTHTHTKSQITDFPTSLPASDVYSWAKESSKPSYSWDEITSKPSTFTPSEHTHNYAGSSSAGGSATSADKLNTNAGSSAVPVYFGDGIPKACTTSGTYTSTGTALFTRAGAYNLYTALKDKVNCYVGSGVKVSASYSLNTSYRYLMLGMGHATSAPNLICGEYIYHDGSKWKRVQILNSMFPGASISGNTLSITYNSDSSATSVDRYVLFRLK